jgi:flagellar FliJ protein
MTKGPDMSKRFPLEVVMELTRRQADEAAAALNGLRQKERAAQQTLDMLEACRSDYHARFARTSQDGLRNEQWRNYHEFIAKLNAAITQQTETLSQCRLQVQAGLTHWQECRVKLKSFDVLLERHQRGELQLESKREQREQDEQSSATHARNRNQET